MSKVMVYLGKDADVYRELYARLAEENERTTSGEIRVALDRHLASYGIDKRSAA